MQILPDIDIELPTKLFPVRITVNGGKTNNGRNGNIFVNGEPVLMGSRNRTSV